VGAERERVRGRAETERKSKLGEGRNPRNLRLGEGGNLVVIVLPRVPVVQRLVNQRVHEGPHLNIERLVFYCQKKQRQHRTLHIQKDVLPYALCKLLCPVSAGLASIFQMDSPEEKCLYQYQQRYLCK
jgi:hypothetical protein